MLTFRRALLPFSLGLCITLESGHAAVSLVLKPPPPVKNRIDKTRCRLGALVRLGPGHFSKPGVAPGRGGVAEALAMCGRNERRGKPKTGKSGLNQNSDSHCQNRRQCQGSKGQRIPARGGEGRRAENQARTVAATWWEQADLKVHESE